MSQNANTLPPAAGQAAHTPTPWEAFDRYTNPETSCRIHYYDEKTGVILGTVCRDLSAANAAFIVRACNSHAALVEALRYSNAMLARIHSNLTHGRDAVGLNDFTMADMERNLEANAAALANEGKPV